MHVTIHSKAAPGVARRFKQQILGQCERLGVAVTFGRAPRDGRRIVVVFARKGSAWTSHEEKTFKEMLAEGVTVLPVVPDPPSAQYLPRSLSHINAFVTGFFGEAWPECLADEVLSLAWLHRRAPRVFVSYKRTDSGPIASQLYDRLSHLGYEAFLDEASVPRGADFQRELKWWLNDADLLIVLASPRFPLSRWCMEEVTFCQQRFIGISMIEWPRAIYVGEPRIRFPDVDGRTRKPVIVDASTRDQVLTLEPRDFAGEPRVSAGRRDPNLPARQLTKDALDRVVALCVRQRTVGIRQRLDNLIPLAKRVLPGVAQAPAASGPGDFWFRGAGGVSSFVRVLPFRPAPENIHQVCSDGARHRISGCFYAENDPYDPRAQALRWLTNCQRPRIPTLSDGWVWACWGDTLVL